MDSISGRSHSVKLNTNLSLALLQQGKHCSRESEQGSEQSGAWTSGGRSQCWSGSAGGQVPGARGGSQAEPRRERRPAGPSPGQWKRSLSVMNKEARFEGRKPRSCGSEAVSFFELPRAPPGPLGNFPLGYFSFSFTGSITGT